MEKPPKDSSSSAAKTQAQKAINTLKENITKTLSNVDKKNFYKNFNYFKDWIKQLRDPKTMADKAGTPGRPMKFPYTFSAKFAQFPLKYYIQNQWIWRYYFISIAVCLPVFYSIHNLANSPANVAKWAEIRRKEAAEHHH